jgi:alpha(1,3/1,4) fucosyltransferase
MNSVHVGLVVDGYTNDRIFEASASRDGFLERFYMLRKYFHANRVECRTADMFEPSTINVLIFHDVMNNLSAILSTIKANPSVKLIYLPNEPSFVIPFHDGQILPQIPTDLVLTWNDHIVDDFAHINKLNIGQPVITKENIPSIPFGDKKFICSIFGYKPSNAPGTLFRERTNAISFFSERPLGIDLYGIGWENSELPFVASIYKGPCDSKKEVQKHYKFAVAYENVGTLPGLITEKIFDCFSSGTVPLYLGAPNIKDYIPPSCFIDVRDFNGYAELYDYLENMSEERYQAYLDAVKGFIETPEYILFTSEHYAKKIVSYANELLGESGILRTPACMKWRLIKLIVSYPQVLRNWRQYKRMIFAMMKIW